MYNDKIPLDYWFKINKKTNKLKYLNLVWDLQIILSSHKYKIKWNV